MPLSLLEFDPYQAWLGIMSPNRPPNPYELLNLVPLDADRSRVRAALDRRLTTLDGKRSGADPEIWQALRDELEAAAATLLDPEQRAVTDAAIKRKLAMTGARRNRSPAAGESETGAMLTCPSCQRENPVNRRFCGGCGQGLREICPQCGGELPGLERFCGHCGTDVHSLLQEQTRRIQERLEAAEQLTREHRYDEALSALRAVAAIDDPKLNRWIAQALGRIEEVETRRRQALAEAEAARQQAAKLIQQSAFEWAVKVLQQIPAPLRDEEVDALLTQARFSSQEMTTLRAEIKTAVQEKRYGGLFAKIGRLLALKPDQQPLLDLADRLQAQFVAAATKRLKEHRYAQAVQWLEQIPPESRSERASSILDQAAELSALLAAVKEAPDATPQALALAKRFVQQAPGNAEAVKLYQELQQKCAERPADRRLAMPPNSAAAMPEQGRLAVQWLGHWLRTEPATEPVAQRLREHPGEFFVALGLALQGLHDAELPTSLMPPAAGGMLGKLASLPVLKRGATSCWGIDLGEYALKAVQLIKDSSGKTQVGDCHYILVNKARLPSPAASNDLQSLRAALSDLATRAEFKTAKVAASLSGRQVLGRFLELPPLPAKKVATAVEYEARHQIPIDLAELCWDWKVLAANADQQADQAPRSILLIAARRSHVEERLSLFKAAGIGVDVIQSDCVALHNALRWELYGGPAATSEPVGMLDIGASQSNFVVSAPGHIWFRSFALAGDNFTTALMRQFQLTRDLAEQLQRHPERARRYSEFREAIEPPLTQLAGEMNRSLDSYQRLKGAAKVQQLFVLGGGANMQGLLRHLRR